MDLGELSREYVDLKQLKEECEEENEDFDLCDQERLDELEKLEDQINCLDFPSTCASMLVVKEDEGKDYAMQYVLDVCEVSDWLRPHINFESVWDDLSTEMTSFEFEGDTYYYQA